jgi:hypothetical protein
MEVMEEAGHAGVERALKPSRQALWASAQAKKVLPHPVGPIISTFWCLLIQVTEASLVKRARSRPREWR